MIMSEKRFEYDIEDERPVIYDNNGVDDYYFINNPEEMKQFVKMINNNEEYWQEKYKSLSNAYTEQLKLNIEQDREIRQLKKELEKKNEKSLNKKDNNKKFDDGRCCNLCGNLETEYHDLDSCGTWISKTRCSAGHDLNETDGTQCEDYYDGE